MSEEALMRNILQERPNRRLVGRLAESASFVEDVNIKDKTVLDIGCGYGWCEMNLLDRGVGRIVGLDVTEKDLETARKHVQDDRATWKTGSATALPFEDESFDTVVCWEVIEHIPKHSEPRMFAEVRRVLKEGGRFFLSTPYDSTLSRWLDPAWMLIGHRHYSSAELMRLGLESDMGATRVATKGGVWSLLATLAMYISKWVLRRQTVFAQFFERRQEREFERGEGIATIFVEYEKAT
jgi:2-polyprenyl-3-methyl-5-hydroxy-6-metoxy-1,4-benzoquinol methylase